MSNSLQALFRPDRLAVIGASAKPEKMGFQIFKNILDAGFGGPVIPVNPKGETILGVPSVKSVEEIPSGTDLAVVIIPAPSVPGAILQLGERKVKAAIVITGGFAESGPDGARLQQEVAENALRCGIRLVGPNCQGVNYPHHGLCASWPLITRRGAMAIASQSGTVGAALADWASQENLGFSAFVSMGNRVDVDEADLIEFFASDPNTKVITLYIEGVKDAPEIPRRRSEVSEADRDLQGRPDRAGTQGRRVAHPLARRQGRDLRRRLPAVQDPPGRARWRSSTISPRRLPTCPRPPAPECSS